MIKSIISMITKLKGESKTHNNKVVCGCYNVTVEDLNNAVKNGAKSFEEVQDVTKVGAGCGNCIEGNKEFVNELIIKNKIKENKIVCGCYKVTAGDIVATVKKGAKSFEEVQRITKVGTGCGRCIEGNKKLVNYLLKK